MPNPRYTNCPTCGGLAEYVSENFKRAGIIISRENDQLQHELRFISKQLEQICEDRKKKITELSSQQIFYLYRIRLQEELIKELEEEHKLAHISKEYFDTSYNKFLEYYNRMLGKMFLGDDPNATKT